MLETIRACDGENTHPKILEPKPFGWFLLPFDPQPAPFCSQLVQFDFYDPPGGYFPLPLVRSHLRQMIRSPGRVVGVVVPTFSVRGRRW